MQNCHRIGVKEIMDRNSIPHIDFLLGKVSQRKGFVKFPIYQSIFREISVPCTKGVKVARLQLINVVFVQLLDQYLDQMEIVIGVMS